jgi:hypothetical protein
MTSRWDRAATEGSDRPQFESVHHMHVAVTRAIVMQHKTKRPVRFEITQATRGLTLAATSGLGE